MIAINKSVSLQCQSCWKYLTRLTISNTSYSPSPGINRSFKLAIRSNHTNNNNRVFYKQNENEYYHSLLSKNKKYAATIAFLDYTPVIEVPDDMDSVLTQDFENQSLMKLITYVHGALLRSHHSPGILDDLNFVRLCKTLLSKIKDIHDDHLINLLKVMALWKEENRNSTFYDICKGIDKVSFSRYSIWNHDRCLLVMDYFYRLHVLRYSEFVWQAMKRLWRDPDRLTSSQVVHAMLLVNAHRTWHPSVHMYNVECYLHQNIYELSVEECAIMALAFFKTQTKIRNMELLDLLYQKLDYRLSTIDSIPLTAFLKLFRFCKAIKMAEKQLVLQKRLTKFIDKHTYFCCTHIALLGTDILVGCPENMDKIAARFVNEISTLRLKDIERTILAFETFNYEPKLNPNPYELALKELIQRKDQALVHPIVFYSTVNYLSLKAYYDLHLISEILSEEFLKKAFKWKEIVKFACPHSILSINNSVQIDCPQYSGNLLNPIAVEQISAFHTWKLPKRTDRVQSNFSTIMLDVKSLLEEMFGGEKFVHFSYVLPHFTRPDLLFRIVDDKPVELPDHVLSKNYVGVELPSKTDDWHVLTFFGTNTTIYGTDEPIGNTAAKLRQLRKLGYKVLCLKESEWTKITQEKRIEYLNQLIKESRVKQVRKKTEQIKIILY